MKFLLLTILLCGGLNLILARSLLWGPYHRHVANPWSRYDYDDELYPLPQAHNSYKESAIDKSSEDSKEESDFEIFSKLFAKSSEDSQEPKEINASDEHDEKDDVAENLRATQLKQIESFFNSMVLDDTSVSKDDTKTEEKSQEKDEDSNEKDNSPEEIPAKERETSEEIKTLNDSKESNEILTFHNTNENDSDEELKKYDLKISEKDIRELTSMLMMISTLEDLMRIAENTTENDDLLTKDELYEKNLKEVDDYLSLFGSLLDKVLDDSSEQEKEKPANNNDNSSQHDREQAHDDKNDSKADDDDDNDEQHKSNEDESVSLEFHGLGFENSKEHFDNHKYDVITVPAVQLQPTSSPYLPDSFSSNANNNNAIQEYVEVREKIDTLEDNLLLNKLNMDKDFYNIIANESDDKNMQNFTNDINVLRDNVYKIKQALDNMQDIKSKLYFHKLIKAALKETQLK